MTDHQLIYKIGIIGPTRVGKTSLITSILKDSHNLLKGTAVSMRASDGPTRNRLNLHDKELLGCLHANEFNAGGLKGTEEPFAFKLELDPGVEDAKICLELLDYPGGWLDESARPPGREKDWGDCIKWIEESSVLLVPVDASVLMEAVQASHKKALPFILTSPEVEQVARQWAKARRQITFKFAASANATGIAVGEITGIAKKGWEYLWVRYADAEASCAKSRSRQIRRKVGHN